MSEAQLREAYTLMKQGDKRGAARIIQDILREDRSNVNAWWLFSHVLDDEEKVVKSLEKVVTLNPEHLGARKRLAQLRPEYAHLAPAPSAAATQGKGKAGVATGTEPKKINKSGLITSFVVFVVVFIISFLFPVIKNAIDSASLANIEGPAPEEVALLQLTAALTGDYESMRLHTCDSLEDEWATNMRSWYEDFEETGFSFTDVRFDLSGLNFLEVEDNGRQRVLELKGELGMSFQGQTVSVDIAELSGFELRMLLVVNDNHWVVCST